jgi:predicted nucleic acid-binding Zn ribbon protein
MSSRRVLRRLAEALEPVTARLEPVGTLAAVQRCWSDVAGAAVAAHAQPVAECEGVLHVACDEAVWASELDLLGPSLVDALNAAIGRPALSSLRARADASRDPAQPRKSG